MKRFFSILICAVMMFNMIAFEIAAEDDNTNENLGVYYTVTFIVSPARSKTSYVAQSFMAGETVVFPVLENEICYENALYYYKFIGWKLFHAAAEINAYYDYKPGYRYSDNSYTDELFTGEAIMTEDDMVFGALYRLVPKKYDIDENKNVTIVDVTSLLNYLAQTGSSDPVHDIDGDGATTIRDITQLLNFLSYGVEIYRIYEGDSTDVQNIVYSYDGNTLYDNEGNAAYSFNGKYVMSPNSTRASYFFDGKYVYTGDSATPEKAAFIPEGNKLYAAHYNSATKKIVKDEVAYTIA